MKNKLVSTNVLAVLSVLLTACSGDWCKRKDAKVQVTEEEVEVSTGNAAEKNAVFFGYDSSKLNDDAKGTVKNAVEAVKASSNAVVTGHCSEEGSEKYNYGLGERRANAVAQELKSMGATNVQTVSYGKSTDFGNGLEKNRRAMIFADGKVAGVDGTPLKGKVATASVKLKKKVSRKSKAPKAAKVDVKDTKAEKATDEVVAA